jgi:hypothetical protein
LGVLGRFVTHVVTVTCNRTGLIDSGVRSLGQRGRSGRLLGFLGSRLFSRSSLNAAATLTHHAGAFLAAKQIAEEVEDRPFAARLAAGLASGLASGLAGLLASRLLAGDLALTAVEPVMETAQGAAHRFLAGRLAGGLASLLASRFAGLGLLAGIAVGLAAGWAGRAKHPADEVSHRLRTAGDALRSAGRFRHGALGRFTCLAGRYVPVGRKQIPQAGKQITTFRPFTGLTCRGWLGTSLTALVEADHAAEHVGSPASAAQHRADHKRSQ